MDSAVAIAAGSSTGSSTADSTGSASIATSAIAIASSVASFSAALESDVSDSDVSSAISVGSGAAATGLDGRRASGLVARGGADGWAGSVSAEESGKSTRMRIAGVSPKSRLGSLGVTSMVVDCEVGGFAAIASGASDSIAAASVSVTVFAPESDSAATESGDSFVAATGGGTLICVSGLRNSAGGKALAGSAAVSSVSAFAAEAGLAGAAESSAGTFRVG